MKRQVYNIAAIIISLIFLVSSSGVKLFAHHCFGCDEINYSIIANFTDCCAHHSVHYSPQAVGCCNIASGEGIAKSDIPEYPQCGSSAQRCCKEEVVYLKNDYEVLMSKQDKRLVPAIIAILPALTERLLLPDNWSELILFSHNGLQPPPRPTGKFFIIFTHYFKVA